MHQIASQRKFISTISGEHTDSPRKLVALGTRDFPPKR